MKERPSGPGDAEGNVRMQFAGLAAMSAGGRSADELDDVSAGGGTGSDAVAPAGAAGQAGAASNEGATRIINDLQQRELRTRESR